MIRIVVIMMMLQKLKEIKQVKCGGMLALHQGHQLSKLMSRCRVVELTDRGSGLDSK
jgi:hypothetical protein